MEGIIQPYAWGSKTFLSELLGEEPTGEPQAELWLGAHASAPSLVGGRPLDQLIVDDPEAMVGAESVAEFGPVLPYLLKVLSAGEPLSLQAHPSRAQAEAGYAAEEAAGISLDDPGRTYRDNWPKPEMLCALEEADVLCGFRAPGDTYALFEQLGVGAALELVQPLRGGDAGDLKEVFSRILEMTTPKLRLIRDVAQAARRLAGEFGRTAQELAERYPEDPGVLAALLMNRLTLQRDEAIYLPAGNLHAYLHGSGVEIMASSNNVLRGGLTSKHVNVPELIKVLDFTPGPPRLVHCVEQQPGVWAYDTPALEFALWRLVASGDELSVPALGAGRVLLVAEGLVTTRSKTQELTLNRGQSAFLTADEDAAVGGSGVVFVAGPGLGTGLVLG